MTADTLPLRPYQQHALQAVERAWLAGTTRPAVVMPTGTGKTVVMAHLAKRAYESFCRPLILVHRDELVRQTVDKLHSVIPGASVGIVKAACNEVSEDITVASVQTLARKERREQLSPPGLIVVDEAHHAAASSWRAVLEDLGVFRPWKGVCTVGFSATLGRADNKRLGGIWQDVVYKQDILEAIGAGWLVDVRAKQVQVDGLDLTTVATSRGDFQDASLSEVLESTGAAEVIVDQWHRHAYDRPTIVFCPSVAACFTVAGTFTAAGITARVVVGDTPVDVRQDIYARHRRGACQVIVSCAVLTEGFDAPWVSCAIIARPTLNDALYTQMVGRILRPFPGKTDALVLDVVGVAGKLRLATIADLSTTHVDPQPGESLYDAANRRKKEEGLLPNGRITLSDVDLFQRSRAAWLRSYGGVWFLDGEEQMWFLVPDDGDTWKVGHKRDPFGGSWLHRGLTFDYAMAWAEQIAMETSPMTATRKRGWRKAPPTEKQEDLALRLGLALRRSATRGDVSDDLSVHYRSPWLDDHFREDVR